MEASVFGSWSAPPSPLPYGSKCVWFVVRSSFSLTLASYLCRPGEDEDAEDKRKEKGRKAKKRKEKP